MRRMAWVLVIALLGAIIGREMPGRAYTALPEVPLERDCVTLERVDLDGDGKEDWVLGQPAAPQGAYRCIAVRSGATGATLLDVRDESFYYEVKVAPVSAPYPILIIGSPSGNWLKLEAFRYDTTEGRLRPLKWDREPFVIGRKVEVDPSRANIAVWTERGVVTYRFHLGALTSGK